jgi:hypothetical protein
MLPHLTKLRSLSLIFALVHSHVVGIENSTSIVSALNFQSGASGSDRPWADGRRRDVGKDAREPSVEVIPRSSGESTLNPLERSLSALDQRQNIPTLQP